MIGSRWDDQYPGPHGWRGAGRMFLYVSCRPGIYVASHWKLSQVHKDIFTWLKTVCPRSTAVSTSLLPHSAFFYVDGSNVEMPKIKHFFSHVISPVGLGSSALSCVTWRTRLDTWFKPSQRHNFQTSICNSTPLLFMQIPNKRRPRPRLVMIP